MLTEVGGNLQSGDIAVIDKLVHKPATTDTNTRQSLEQDALSESIQRGRRALENVLAVLQEYGAQSDYFYNQLVRGAAVVEEVRVTLQFARSLVQV